MGMSFLIRASHRAIDLHRTYDYAHLRGHRLQLQEQYQSTSGQAKKVAEQIRLQHVWGAAKGREQIAWCYRAVAVCLDAVVGRGWSYADGKLTAPGAPEKCHNGALLQQKAKDQLSTPPKPPVQPTYFEPLEPPSQLDILCSRVRTHGAVGLTLQAVAATAAWSVTMVVFGVHYAKLHWALASDPEKHTVPIGRLAYELSLEDYGGFNETALASLSWLPAALRSCTGLVGVTCVWSLGSALGWFYPWQMPVQWDRNESNTETPLRDFAPSL